LHALPHWPQWAVLDETETHAPLHKVCPMGHEPHTPFTHASSEKHALLATQQRCPRAPHAPASGRSGSEKTTSRVPTSGVAPSGRTV
jgi:hypothetical protein